MDSAKLKINLTPYYKLLRLDKPTGIWLLLWPTLLAVVMASSKSIPYVTILVFTAGAWLMRSSGCIINDIADRKIDPKVKRTKNRPLASGELKLIDAVVVLILLLTTALVILLFQNKLTQMLGVVIIPFIALYPYMKRITYWPQLFLGLTFSWGAIMGWSAIQNSLPLPAYFLYAASVFWTIGFDTIYSHQDKDDDSLIGVKSTALRFGHFTKKFLLYCYSLTVIFLWLAGVTTDQHIVYYIALIFGIIHLIWQVFTLDINNPENCHKRFTSNKIFGLIMFSGAFLSLLLRVF